ncbi:MAG: DinB family protein [Acidimicrobiia bacterium]
MPGNAPFHADETDLLLGFLDQQRTVLRNAAFGLTDEQARTAATASPLSVGGLLKHCALGEQMWMGVVRQEAENRDPDAYLDSFVMRDDETLDGILALADEAAAATDALVRGIGDLDHPVPVPKGVPWYPQDLDAWSLRWVVLHLVEEIARHAGHADVIREAVDGATAFPLMAAVEGWPETPWMKPWQPA